MDASIEMGEIIAGSDAMGAVGKKNNGIGAIDAGVIGALGSVIDTRGGALGSNS